MANQILIKNGQFVSDGEITTGDMLITNDRIAAMENEISAPENCEVVDAKGRYLLPGMIDDQVHFREPGLTHKGDIFSESRAAVAGGITSFMEMPNTQPTTTTLQALEAKYAIAAQSAAANYAFYLGATNDNLDVIRALDPRAAAGIKVFMGSSTGNMLVDNESTLAGIFRDSPVIITTHCESTPRIQDNLQKAIKKFGKNIPLEQHPVIRDAEACFQSSSMAISLAREHDAQLHILHLTTEREMALFEPGPIEGKSITAEVCAHHLYFNSDDYSQFGNLIKCNPAIKSPSDQNALREALKAGRLDIIATDHAPHTTQEKAAEDYLQAPAGLPLVQDALLSVLEMVHDDFLTLPEIVTKTAHNPAIRFNVKDRGYLREGYFADLVMVDTKQFTDVSNENVLARCGWSPFAGQRFRSRIESTWVNGSLAWHQGQLVPQHAAQRLEFDR